MKKFEDIQEIISWIETRKRLSPKVSLDRMNKILEIYDNPHKKNKYIHVAGTNGKGSTVMYIKNILHESKKEVGYYISPYIIKFNERIGYNNNYITDEEILDIGNYIVSKYDEFDKIELNYPTFFEFVTLMAFIYYTTKKLDIVILEVGLGGRLDCTNVIDPIASIITNVTYDHMDVLGNTLEEIAYNKLGIVKDNRPLFTIYNPYLDNQIRQTCNMRNSELNYFYTKDIENINLKLECSTFSYKNHFNCLIKLPGLHQIENACLSILVIDYLISIGYKISEEDIKNGLKKTFWPGRLEIISTSPLIILDGAHNIDGITRLSSYISSIKSNKYVRLIFAVSSNKEKDKMIQKLEEIADEIIFSHFNYKRSDDENYLLSLSNHKNRRVMSNIDEIVSLVEEKNDYINLFCGSLYFISEVRKKFNK